MVQAIVKNKIPPNISIITQATNNYIMGSTKKRQQDEKTRERRSTRKLR